MTSCINDCIHSPKLLSLLSGLRDRSCRSTERTTIADGRKTLQTIVVMALAITAGQTSCSREIQQEHPVASAPSTAGTEAVFAEIAFIWCPPGSFELGSNMSPQDITSVFHGREEWYADELPATPVSFRQGFWLSKYEVSRDEYARVMKAKPWEGVPDIGEDDPESPAVKISWNDAQLFAQTLSTSGEGRFRLPTEAEWEYACRAGTTQPFFFGDDAKELGEYAWFRGNTSDAKESYVHKRGLKKPNQWGLYDTLGNAWEWCDSVYAPYTESGGAGSDDNVVTAMFRVIRGGCYALPPGSLRVSFRTGQRADTPDARIGFRVVREP